MPCFKSLDNIKNRNLIASVFRGCKQHITEVLLVVGMTHVVLCADVTAHGTTSQPAAFLLLHYIMIVKLCSVVSVASNCYVI
jgi:hypothetical protein